MLLILPVIVMVHCRLGGFRVTIETYLPVYGNISMGVFLETLNPEASVWMFVSLPLGL